MIDATSIDRLLTMISVEHRQKSEIIGRALASWDAMTSQNLGQAKWIQVCHPSDPSIYGQFVDSSITLRTLVNWAQIDSNADYQRWYQEWLISSLVRGTSGLEVDLSETLFRIYWLKNICGRLEPPAWFVFDQTRWVATNETEVFTHFLTGLTRRYEFLRANLIRELSTSTDTRLKDQGEGVINGIIRVLDKLRQSPFQTNLLKECRDRFFEPINRKLDADPSLVGCQNGILEIIPMSNGPPNLSFRRTGFDDYISKQLGVAYRQPSPEILAGLTTLLNQMFPDSGELLLQLLYDGLIGQQSSVLPIFIGAIEFLNRLVVALAGTYGLTGAGNLPKRSLPGSRFTIITLSEDSVSDERLLSFIEQPGIVLLMSQRRPQIRTRFGRIRIIPVSPVPSLEPLDHQVVPLAVALFWQLVNGPISRQIHSSITQATSNFWNETN